MVSLIQVTTDQLLWIRTWICGGCFCAALIFSIQIFILYDMTQSISECIIMSCCALVVSVSIFFLLVGHMYKYINVVCTHTVEGNSEDIYFLFGE